MGQECILTHPGNCTSCCATQRGSIGRTIVNANGLNAHPLNLANHGKQAAAERQQAGAIAGRTFGKQDKARSILKTAPNGIGLPCHGHRAATLDKDAAQSACHVADHGPGADFAFGNEVRTRQQAKHRNIGP